MSGTDILIQYEHSRAKEKMISGWIYVLNQRSEKDWHMSSVLWRGIVPLRSRWTPILPSGPTAIVVQYLSPLGLTQRVKLQSIQV